MGEFEAEFSRSLSSESSSRPAAGATLSSDHWAPPTRHSPSLGIAGRTHPRRYQRGRRKAEVSGNPEPLARHALLRSGGKTEVRLAIQSLGRGKRYCYWRYQGCGLAYALVREARKKRRLLRL